MKRIQVCAAVVARPAAGTFRQLPHSGTITTCLWARQASTNAAATSDSGATSSSPIPSSVSLDTKQHIEGGNSADDNQNSSQKQLTKAKEGETGGAMSERLAAMAEDAVAENPRFMKAAAESGDLDFSEDLKEQLLERVQQAKFKTEHQKAFSIASIPKYAGQGTRDIAMADAWTGEESSEDTMLRMLDDAHKPLRGRRKPTLGGSGINVDLRPSPRIFRTASQRIADARDRTTEYNINKSLELSDEEREERTELFRERFSVGGRPSVTVNAISSLADQRIEEARARGQFKNLPRGKPIERDHNADSPYLNTTEYFLNRMIKSQEIVPPWIEKQQDLIRTLDVFRTRLRVEWKRYVVRAIASEGGTIEQQVAKAERYALAEKAIQEGNEPPNLQPFRDKTWEKTENSYHTLAIENLNSLTRSYNLIAPELAKKPYYSLERELKACYAAVAPQIAAEIINRAKNPGGGGSSLKAKKKKEDGKGVGIWDSLAGEQVPLHEDTKPVYGFKEFWKDIFAKKKEEKP